MLVNHREYLKHEDEQHVHIAPIKAGEFSDVLNVRYAQQRERLLCRLRSPVRIGIFRVHALQEALDHLHKLTGTEQEGSI